MSQERSIHWVEAFGLSALVHVGAVFLVIDFLNDIQLFRPAEEEPVDILVTSLVLDSQTIADAAVTSGGAGGDEGEGEDPGPESLDPVEPEPETLAAAEPEDLTEPDPVEELEPVEPELPEPETPAPVAAESLTPEPVTPDTLEPELADIAPETLEPVAPALAPEPLSPLRPDDDSVAALVPLDGGSGVAGTATLAAPVTERLTASAPSAEVATIAPAIGTSTTTIAPVINRPAVSPPAPPRPAVAPPTPGSPAAVVAELVAKIRASVADPCLVAMPQQGADGAPELVMLAADETSVTDFAAEVLEGIEPRPGQRGVLVDPRQCPAATYIRENASYPAFRLEIGLSGDVVPSGGELSGAVARAGGRYVSLLLVDVNGVVQDVGSYLTFGSGEARFSIPIRRDGPNRDTSQMLIALATDSRPDTLDAQNGQLAEDFFPALRTELGTRIPIVMIPFDVR